MKAEIAARDGDLRLCLLLGIAAWFLFLDHIPHNAVSLLTMRNFGFSGATDLFVFVGGYTAAILYGKMMLERGLIVSATRIFKRLWQLYAAYVVLFVIYIDLIGYVARKSAAPELISEFNVSGIVDHTIRTLIYGLLLQAKPLNLDVLQLFIVLMAFFPVVLFGMMRRPNLTAAGSIVLYIAARHFDWNLSAYPDGHWYFNPFCWQLLFVSGAWFALSGARTMRAIGSLQELASPAPRCGAVLAVRAGRDAGGKIAATGPFHSGSRARRFPSQRQGKHRPLPGAAFSRHGVALYLAGAEELARLSMARFAADHEVRRGMAACVLRQRVSVVCRAPGPDHGPGLACNAGSRQRRRNFDHDRRRLLCVVVQTAGPEAGIPARSRRSRDPRAYGAYSI